MFDIGFSEILLIVVVALLVVGPRELPGMLRTLGEWTGKTRRMIGSVKAEFEKEIQKADEIQRRLAEEVRIAEKHLTLDEDRRAAPADASVRKSAGVAADSTPPAAQEAIAQSAGDHKHEAAKS